VHGSSEGESVLVLTLAGDHGLQDVRKMTVIFSMGKEGWVPEEDIFR